MPPCGVAEPTCQRLEYRDYYEDPTSKCRTRVRVKHRRCQGSCGGTSTGFCCLPRKIKTRRVSSCSSAVFALKPTLPDSGPPAVRAAQGGPHFCRCQYAIVFLIVLYHTVCSLGIDRNFIEGENIRQKCHQARLHGVLFSRIEDVIISPLLALLSTRVPIFL